MIQDDTIKLLRECDSGMRMALDALEEAIDEADAHELKVCLLESKHDHEQLKGEINARLRELHDEGKEPGALAKGMAWLKTNVRLELNDSDRCIADLLTEGCYMGMKSLQRYLNQYRAADDRARELAEKLICLEERLAADLRPYL